MVRSKLKKTLTDQRILTGSSSNFGSSSGFSSNSNPFTNSFSGGSSFNRNEFSSSSSSSSFNDNPCSSFSCGSNADCTQRSFRAVCTCRSGYEGDPYSNCRRSECVGKFSCKSSFNGIFLTLVDCLENSECPSNKLCHNNKCINPCSTLCGVDAECTVRNHVTTCQCPRGFTGDPFTSCVPSSSQLNSGSRQQGGGGFTDYCNPTPCGANSKCRVENSRAVCSCLEGWIGNATLVINLSF